jgi:hypothetical protein
MNQKCIMSNDQKKSTPKEAIEIELNVVLEEYKTLREEMLTNIDASRQVLNLTLTGTGLFLAISPLFIQSQLPILFLTVPFVFYAMAWAQLRYVLLIHDISDYLREVIEPRIRKNLSELAPTTDRDFSAVLGWSNRGGGLLQHHKSIFILPIAGANYGIPLLAAVFSVVAYFVIVFRGVESITVPGWFLLALNACALVYSVVWGFRVEFKK